VGERHTHQAAAATNYSVGRTLDGQGGDLSCWTPTVIFYCAVQVLYARLADNSLHPRNQGDLYAHTADLSRDSTGPAGYRKLKTLSESWRYHAARPSAQEIASAWRWAESMVISIGEPWPPT
jgi:hypothetical protein